MKLSTKNHATPILLILLTQKTKELDHLKMKNMNHEGFWLLLEEEIRELEDSINFMKQSIISNCLKEKLILNNVARSLIQSTGLEKEIYKELFTRKMSNEMGIILIDLLEIVLDQLDESQILRISLNKKSLEIPIILERAIDILTKQFSECPDQIPLENLWEIAHGDNKRINSISPYASEYLENLMFKGFNMDEIINTKQEGDNYDKYKGKRKVK